MPILYALISRDTNVLAEYTCTGGNFPTVTRVLLGKISIQDDRMSYSYDKHVFHYIVSDGIIFLCMADPDMSRRAVFAFLEDIITIWRERVSSIEQQSAIAFSWNDQFAPILQERIDYYNKDPKDARDTISRVKSQIDSVKEAMIENIDRILERGEKIELLVDKTDDLNSESFKFVRNTTKLRNHIWYSNLRVYLLIAGVVLVITGIIIFAICGGPQSICRPHH